MVKGCRIITIFLFSAVFSLPARADESFSRAGRNLKIGEKEILYSMFISLTPWDSVEALQRTASIQNSLEFRLADRWIFSIEAPIALHAQPLPVKRPFPFFSFIDPSLSAGLELPIGPARVTADILYTFPLGRLFAENSSISGGFNHGTVFSGGYSVIIDPVVTSFRLSLGLNFSDLENRPGSYFSSSLRAVISITEVLNSSTAYCITLSGALTQTKNTHPISSFPLSFETGVSISVLRIRGVFTFMAGNGLFHNSAGGSSQFFAGGSLKKKWGIKE